MSVTYEKSLIKPLISLTSPLETNVKTLFFPPMGEVVKTKSAGSLEEVFQGDADISNAEVVSSKRRVKTAVLSRVKPDKRPIDPGHNYMDHLVTNKENRDYYYDRNVTRGKLPARHNTTHVLEHVSTISGNMSESRTKIKKDRETGSLRGNSQSKKQSFSSARTTRDKKSGVTLRSDRVNSTVHDLRFTKLTPKETLPRHSVISNEVSKATAVKAKHKKSRPDSLPNVEQNLNQPLLHVGVNNIREARTWRLSPRFLLDQIAEEPSMKDPKIGMSRSGTKPKGVGTKISTPEDKTKAPGNFGKVSSNVSSVHKKNDKSPRGATAGDRVQEMALPKVTINEVLQSWNIGPQRTTRSSSLAAKDPMEFLRRDRSLSDPKNRPTTYDDLRSCRYLRTDKDDADIHGRLCSCNSCEHGEGLRSTPYLNS